MLRRSFDLIGVILGKVVYPAIPKLNVVAIQNKCLGEYPKALGVCAEVAER